MHNEENAINAKNLHVDSFKYQSIEDILSVAYSSLEEKHPKTSVFKHQCRNIAVSHEWQEMIIIYTDYIKSGRTPSLECFFHLFTYFDFLFPSICAESVHFP